MTFAEANAWRDRFAAIPFEDKGGYFQGRYYQDIAIDRVLEAIAAERQRILLTLATGTGKTGSPPSTLTDHVNSRAVLVLKCLTINELRRSISEMEGR
jgi:superfamily II DNA or RNA helicase